MYSVELYRRLQRTEHPPGWVECGGIRLAVSAGAAGGDPPPGRLGRGRRPAAAGDLRRRGARAVPADGPDGVLGARLPAVRRLGRPVPAVHWRWPPGPAPAASGSPPHPGAGDRHRGRTDGGGCTRVRTDRGDIECEIVVELRRDVRRRDRPAGRRPGADRADVAPVPGHRGASWRARAGPRRCRRLRDPDLLVYYRQEVRRAADGRVRARPGAVDRRTARRCDADPGRLQRPAAAGGLGRGSSRSPRTRSDPGAGDGRRRRPHADQRAGGVHPGQRVLPRRDRGRRVLRRRRVLRARHRRRGRDRQGDGRVDRRPASRRWTSGTWTSAGSAPQYGSPSFTLARTLENYQTYYDIAYPDRERTGRPAAADLPGVRLARRARRRVRREGRLGAGELLRARTRRPATRRCGRTAGPGAAGRRRSGPSTGPPGRRPACSTSRRSPRSRSPGRTRRRCWSGCATTGWPAAVGAVTYTQALNARGGIEADVTVTRLATEEFLVVTGTAFGAARPGLAAAAGPDAGAVDVAGSTTSPGSTPVSRSVGTAVAGDAGPLTPADLSNDGFGS